MLTCCDNTQPDPRSDGRKEYLMAKITHLGHHFRDIVASYELAFPRQRKLNVERAVNDLLGKIEKNCFIISVVFSPLPHRLTFPVTSLSTPLQIDWLQSFPLEMTTTTSSLDFLVGSCGMYRTCDFEQRVLTFVIGH